MPNEKFTFLIDKFEGINLFDSSNDLRPGECTDLRDLVVQGRRLILGKELSTTNLPTDASARWMKIWADSQDTWYIMLAIDDSTNTDLKHYSGGTWGTSATFTDLFASDKTSTPDSYTIGGELRIGGSLTNYHKYIKYWPLTYRYGVGIQNGTFTGASTGWTLSDAAITYGSNLIDVDGNQTGTESISQGAGLVAGEFYEVIFTITRSSGTCWAACGTTTGTVRNSGGTYTQTLSAAGNATFFIYVDSDFTGTIDTITVRSYKTKNNTPTAGLFMEKGEIESPNDNSEVTLSYSASGTSDKFLEGDVVQYALSYIYDNAQESLLYIDSNTTTTTAGQKIAVTFKPTRGSAYVPWRVSHVNIYRSLNGGDYYLLSRVHIDDGQLETSNAWDFDGSTGKPYITVDDTGKVITNSYTSITGYPDYDSSASENNLKAYFKVCTVCQGRAVIGNVKREVGSGTEIYNDRLYFSQVGRFDSFYKTDWVDLETGDGDQVTALLEFGNEIIVFKQNNMYIWNMGTRDELNWYRRSAYRGYGVLAQQNVVNTPYGVAFTNDNGIYLFRGQSEPEEISRKLKDGFTGDSIHLGYDTVNRRILGFEGVNFIYLIDLDDGFITKQTGVGSITPEAFDIYDNDPYWLASNQVYNINGTASLVAPGTFYVSGDMNLNTDRYKRVQRVRIKYKAVSTGSPTLTFGISGDYGANYTSVTLAETDGTPPYTTVEFFPEIYSRQFRFRLIQTVAGVDTLEIDSIEVSGKIYRN